MSRWGTRPFLLDDAGEITYEEFFARVQGLAGALTVAGIGAGDENGVVVPHGEVDEIQVERNLVMMLGYICPEGEQPRLFDRHWFRTGDLGYRDEEGFFHFVGRLKNVIRRRGENIFPGQIERVLQGHPAVPEAAVIGVPDPFGGEEIKVYVVPADGHTLSLLSLVHWCKGRLAEFQIPRYWSVCRELPRTATNKIHRIRLADLHDATSSFDRSVVTPLGPAETVAPERGDRSTGGRQGVEGSS